MLKEPTNLGVESWNGIEGTDEAAAAGWQGESELNHRSAAFKKQSSVLPRREGNRMHFSSAEAEREN